LGHNHILAAWSIHHLVFFDGAAVSANVAELTIFADGYWLFGDVPAFFEAEFFNGYGKGCVFCIAKRFWHLWAVFRLSSESMEILI